MKTTLITVDSHESEFDYLVHCLNTLDTDTAKTVKRYVSRMFPTLIRPYGVVLPTTIKGHRVLANAIRGLVQMGSAQQNEALNQLASFCEEQPEIFLSLVNDSFKMLYVIEHEL
jgi:hypothetical protein